MDSRSLHPLPATSGSAPRALTGRWIWLAWVGLSALPAAGGGCSSEPHCVTCIEGDADAGGEGDVTPAGDECSPSPEQCDDHDHDCDGDPMNGFNLLTDPANCGGCGHACSLPGAAGSCAGGECSYACLPNHHDVNGDLGQPLSNGCEYPCVLAPGGIELSCNLRDDDCDTLIDEEFASDVNNCGECFDACFAAHAVATCDDQDTPDSADDACSYQAPCHEGYADLDGDDEPTDTLGCEYTCPVYPPLFEELCNNVDDNCDGEVDELPITGLGGDCYPSTLDGCEVGVGCRGICDFGVLRCSFGIEICSGYRGPEPAEQCDDLDHDCDGELGCEDQCISPPLGMMCKNQGECDGPTPVCSACNGVTTWRCDYRGSTGAVEVDSCGRLVLQETSCDGLDNDCDLAIDESFPQVANSPTEEGDQCEAGVGICRGTGRWICDPADDQAVLCEITEPGQQPLPYELCNNVDDNCNGLIDELADNHGGPISMLDSMITVTAGTTSSGDSVAPFLIDAYEASRPDADADSGGSAEHLACSNPGVVPWRTVTHAEAEAACLAAGKRLCTEAEWQRACEGAGPFAADYVSYPYGVAYDRYACNGWGYDYDCTSPNDHFLLYPTGNDYGCPAAAGTCFSDFGVYDLSGNLQEWTSSLVSTGPNTYRVRGGSYQTQPDGLTCQHAFIAFDDTIAFPGLGFRCCQDMP